MPILNISFRAQNFLGDNERFLFQRIEQKKNHGGAMAATIIWDAGHGGYDNGASCQGRKEKLEMDRRLIKTRLSQLKRKLAEVQQHREITRGQRSRNHTKVAAIVGYTNAGKSTLLNRLTNFSVLEEDKSII